APLHVPRDAQVWLRNREDGPRRAGVSAISIDGTCMHAVLEGVERPSSVLATERARPLGDRGTALFLCRGDEAELRALVSRGGSIEDLAARWFRRGASGRVTRAVV